VKQFLKDNILVWIGNSFTHFGIVKSLQEKYDCNLFAISDADKWSKRFLEEQNSVNFEKIWYYPFHTKNISGKPDINYLKKFEKKYKIDIWQIAFVDRKMNYFNRYYNFSHDEVLSIMEQACRFCEKVLEESKPKFLLIKITKFHNDHLLYKMCQKLGIKVLMLRPSRFAFKTIISEEVDKLDSIDIQIKNNSELEPKEYLKKFSFRNEIKQIKTNYKIGFSRKIKSFFSFILNNEIDDFRNLGKTRKNIFLKSTAIGLHFRKKSIKSFVDKNALQDLGKNIPFVYFPLHKEPERSLSIGAPYYTNQLTVIENIAKSLPVKYRLFVKDHPAMLKTTMWVRSKEFYKRIIDLPNVELIHHSVNQDKILEKCELVIAIKGSSALEAALENKPSIIFDDVDFAEISSIFVLKNIEELPITIKNALKSKVKKSEVVQFLKKIDDNSVEYNTVGLMYDFMNKFPHPGFNQVPEYSEKKISSHIKKFKDSFDRLADEHIRKIQIFKSN
jgi:hypothetical protein